MKEYYLSLAGLRTVLRAPYDITISGSLQPFLTEKFEEKDCSIEISPCDSLPSPLESGVWHGLEYYDCSDGVSRVFYRLTPDDTPFAVTQIYGDGRIKVEVLTEYITFFSGSSGIFNRIGIESFLLRHSGLLLHASLIKYNGKTVAFAGPSSVGKSTQAGIWNTYFGARILNGDRAVLRKTEDVWMAYGSPYAGTSGIYENDSGPLAAVIMLRQAKKNKLYSLAPTEAFKLMYPELSVHQWDRDFITKTTDVCLQLISETPVYLLECTPDMTAAEIVKKGLGL